jgi:hypothetical protein
MKLLIVCSLVLASHASCVSNPTPHPAQDATADTSRGDDSNNVATPQDQEGCEGAGGFWDGSTCYLDDGPDTGFAEVNTPDLSDAEVGDGVADPDGDDSDGGDAGPDVGPDTDDGAGPD